MITTDLKRTEAVAERLIHWIETLGWRARLVPIEHLSDLQKALVSLHEAEHFDESFYQEHLAGFSFGPPPDLPEARSIIILAMPTPPMRVFFSWKGRRMPVILPPTYVSYSPRTESSQLAVRLWLENAGYGATKANLPLKTLAVRCGLGDQGRNNLCYVFGMGSFLQLVGLFSDLPCMQDPWREPKMLARCATCAACLERCPSGAIDDDRFLLHAERCLTLLNESAEDFPDWAKPSWHHCLLGCMRCQDRCPENRGVTGWVEDRIEFSETETSALLDQRATDRLPGALVAKLRSLELNYDQKLLGRNLAAIIRIAEVDAS